MINGGLLLVKVNLDGHRASTILTRTPGKAESLQQQHRSSLFLPENTNLGDEHHSTLSTMMKLPLRDSPLVTLHLNMIGDRYLWQTLDNTAEHLPWGISTLQWTLLSTRCPHNAKAWQRKRRGDPTGLELRLCLHTSNTFEFLSKGF